MKAAGLAALVFLAVALLAGVDAFPGARRDSSESSETDERNDGLFLVLPRRNIMDDTSLFGGSSSSSGSDEDDDEIPSIWHPFKFQFNSSPFENFLSRMQATMNKIRAEMAATLAAQLESSHLPQLPHESPVGQLDPLPGWGRLPEGANTTSTTKIVGNHTVTINETTYTDGDENSGMVYRIRVVDVKPLSPSVTTTIDESAAAASPVQPTTTTTTTADSDEVAEPQAAPVPNTDDNDEDNLDEQQQKQKPSKKEKDATSPEQQPESDIRDREELTTQSHRSAETIDEFDNEIPKNQFETVAL